MSPSRNRSWGIRLLSGLQNLATTQSNAHNESSADTNKHNDIYDMSLKIENILLEEYKSSQSFTLQTLQDRASTQNLYFVLIGIFATGLGVIYQISGMLQVYTLLLLAIILITGCVIHFFFFGRFVSLEILYQNHIARTNIIREFYIQRFQADIPNIGSIINQSSATKLSSGYHRPTNLPVCIALALIGSLCLAISIFLLSFILTNKNATIPNHYVLNVYSYIFGIVAGIINLLVYFVFYRLMVHSVI